MDISFLFDYGINKLEFKVKQHKAKIGNEEHYIPDNEDRFLFQNLQ